MGNCCTSEGTDKGIDGRMTDFPQSNIEGAPSHTKATFVDEMNQMNPTVQELHNRQPIPADITATEAQV